MADSGLDVHHRGDACGHIALHPDAVRLGPTTVYIGTLFATSLMLLLARAYLRSHPDLHTMDDAESVSGIRASGIVSGLFLAALVLAVAIPGAGNWPLLLMLLSEPLQRLDRRRSRRARKTIVT